MSRRHSKRLLAERQVLRLCGGGGDTTLLSACGNALLPFVSTLDARALRATCREGRGVVAAFPFEEAGYWSEVDQEWKPGTLIGGRTGVRASVCLRRWRACFPNARGANVSGTALTLADARRYLTGMRALDISECPQITGEWFSQAFMGIERLYMNDCYGVEDGAFAATRDTLKYLVCGNCFQLTDAAFPHLGGLETLVMWNIALSDAAFEHLKGVKTLLMGNCSQETITDAAFEHLQGVERLLMFGCDQETITDTAFKHLEGGHLRQLDISGCNQGTLTDDLFHSVKGALEELNMEGCTQLSDEGLKQLGLLKRLNVRDCPQLSGAFLDHCPALASISLAGCAKEVRRKAKARGLEITQ
jgi:hypothetical protein